MQHLSYLLTLFFILRQICEHILHIVQACCTVSSVTAHIYSLPLYKKASYVPTETSIILEKFVKVSHEFVNGIFHMHVSKARPDSISIRKSCGHIFPLSLRCVELVPGS